MMVLPINLNGCNLGERHKQLNTLSNEFITSKLPLEQIKDVAETCDVERLLKIDVANAQRNVEYILYNLQSDDVLYVSRALRSTWLIKDPQYAHIVNPQYMHNELFPLMINRAICKFKLTIRLQLTDQCRCEEFFQYYFDNNDKRQALLYLPLCSEKFVIDKIQNNHFEIPSHLVKRLCEKVPKVAYEISKKCQLFTLKDCIDKLRFLAKCHTEVYLDIIDKQLEKYGDCTVNLGKRSTFAILRNNRERVFGKPKHYIRMLHLSTVAKTLGSAKVKELIVKLSKNPDLDGWFSYRNIQPLLKAINHKETYEFLRSIFKKRETYMKQRDIGLLQDDNPDRCDKFIACNSMACTRIGSTISNIYEWYRYAPFSTAFPELQKLICIEPKSNERLAMLNALIHSAKKNYSHIKQLIQYFHGQHIKETKNFREHFVKNLLKSTEAFRYNDECWKTLEELFHNLKVYVEGSPYNKDCVETIILYHVLRDSPIPSIILEKWHNAFSTLQPMAKKLMPNEKKMVFGLLYAELMTKINELSLNSSDDLHKVIVLTNNSLELLKKWNQPLSQHQDLLELLKIIIHKTQTFSLMESLKYYDQDKKWNRLLFSEALLMLQTQDVLINTLKHNIDLLNKHEVQVQCALETEGTNLDLFFSKLRVYFYNDVAIKWTEGLKETFNELHGKRVVRAMYILMPRDSVSELVKTYIPQSHETECSEESAAQLSLRKYLAQQMYLVRPLINVSDVLAFAKEDYLQYALPSLYSVCFQLPVPKCQSLLPQLLEETVPFQKLAIRLAFARLPLLELQNLFPKVWEKANNAAIRAVVLKLTHEMLCQEKDEDKIVQIWELLHVTVGKLTTDEVKSIYSILGKAQSVPEKVRPNFCAISYRYLKTVPKKINCYLHISMIIDAMVDITENLDKEFVYEVINSCLELAYAEDGFYTDPHYNDFWSFWLVFENFLLVCKTKDEQLERYNRVGQVFMNHTKRLWNISCDIYHYERELFERFLELITIHIKEMILVRNRKYITPLPLIERLFRDVQTFVLFHEHTEIYIVLRLIIIILESFDSLMDDLAEVLPDEGKEFDTFLYRELGKCFGLKCGSLYEEYSASLFTSFLDIYARKVSKFITEYLGYTHYKEHSLFSVSAANALSMDPNNVPYVLLAIAILPTHRCPDEVKTEYAKVFKRIQAMENPEIKLHFSNTFKISENFID